MGFTEIADRVWVARYAWYDVNVTLVGGSGGLLVVDTNASADAAREVVADIRSLGAGEVVGVVNTHDHVDHVLGNGTLRASYDGPHGPGTLPVHAHEAAAEICRAAASHGIAGEESDDPRWAEVLATELVPPDRTFSSATTIDLGDRFVELVHPGRGHTAGDLVVRVPDAGVVVAGDLVEESGTPGFGADCYPLDWPLALDLVLGLISTDSVVVPGHGAPVDRNFVEEQRSAIGVVAETIRDLASRGVLTGQALAAAEAWPYPREQLADAVRRGYEHLPRSQKRLPLV